MYSKYIKRIIDVMVGIVMLPVLVIIFIIISPLIIINDRGPIMYNASRVGKGYKIFKMYKFRSMYVNAPDIRNEDGSTYNSESDPRVTKIGRFLRKTSIDEMPQFLNVLKGDMSLVGPRPILPKEDYSEMQDYLDSMMKYRPGLTGYNQAYFRNSVDRLQKYKNDAYYCNNITFLMDLKIIIETVKSVILKKNINTN